MQIEALDGGHLKFVQISHFPGVQDKAKKPSIANFSKSSATLTGLYAF